MAKKENRLVIIKPELIEEWNFERNNELELDIRETTIGMRKKVWWFCYRCSSDYFSSIANRFHGKACPYCSGRKVNHTNSLYSINPTLASEWHPTMNGDLTPHDVTYCSGQKVWWLGECGHKWDSTVANRENKQECPYCCHNPKVLRGFNDLWTVNPRVASLLESQEEGYKYTQNSDEKLNWKCSNCKEKIQNKRIKDITMRGLACPKCSDKISYGEKIFFSVLKQLDIRFKKEMTFKWSDKKRYDFYLPYHNIIIEIHGSQHYEQTKRKGGRSLEEEQDNDKYKYELAMKNGTDKYIVIDCRKSDLEWIKNSIMNSELANIFDLDDTDWMECDKYASNSLILEVCKYWSENRDITTADIVRHFDIGRSTAVRFLSKGKKNGWCDYDARNESRKSGIVNGKNNSREVVQLDLNGSFIRKWESMSDVKRELGIGDSHISNVCKNKRKTAGGFKWMYKEEYDKLIKSK